MGSVPERPREVKRWTVQSNDKTQSQCDAES